jgi:hypothetical protein
MKWAGDNRVFIRITTLVLFTLSMLGPWMFERINVPAEYDCGKPYIRLESDFCGYPMPGFQVLPWFSVSFMEILVQMSRGTFTGRARELLIGLAILPLLPFFSTLLLMWKKDSRRLRTINLVAWSLALIPPLTIFILEINRQIVQLWGLWLYILVAVGAVIIEILLMKTDPVTE